MNNPNQILKEFFDHIEEDVEAGQVSRYSRLEEIVIKIFLEWLLDNYIVTKNCDQLHTNYTYEEFCKVFDNEPEPHE